MKRKDFSWLSFKGYVRFTFGISLAFLGIGLIVLIITFLQTSLMPLLLPFFFGFPILAILYVPLLILIALKWKEFKALPWDSKFYYLGGLATSFMIGITVFFFLFIYLMSTLSSGD